jgi:Family of unknown function (DUF6941)
MALPPQAKTMILCDDLLKVPATDKVHLIGVFNAIRPRGEPPFPYRCPEFCVFLQLTDTEGEGLGSITTCMGATDRVVFASQDQPIEFLDRLQVKWVLFRIRNCPFPEPGLYWVQFHFAGQLLTEQRLRLLR